MCTKMYQWSHLLYSLIGDGCSSLPSQNFSAMGGQGRSQIWLFPNSHYGPWGLATPTRPPKTPPLSPDWTSRGPGRVCQCPALWLPQFSSPQHRCTWLLPPLLWPSLRWGPPCLQSPQPGAHGVKDYEARRGLRGISPDPLLWDMGGQGSEQEPRELIPLQGLPVTPCEIKWWSPKRRRESPHSGRTQREGARSWN